MTTFAFGKTVYSANQEYSNEPTYKNFLFNRAASILDTTQERLDYKNSECSDCPELSFASEIPDGETECQIVFNPPPVTTPTPSASTPAPSPSSSSPSVTSTPSGSSGGSTPTPSTSGTTPTPTPDGSTPTPSVSV